jgi:hypothetical protein
MDADNLITSCSKGPWSESFINSQIERDVLGIFNDWSVASITHPWAVVSITHPWVQLCEETWCDVCHATSQETNLMHQSSSDQPSDHPEYVVCIRCVNEIRRRISEIMASKWLMLDSIVGADISRLVMSVHVQCVCSCFTPP